jgi:hypothetical protein
MILMAKYQAQFFSKAGQEERARSHEERGNLRRAALAFHFAGKLDDAIRCTEKIMKTNPKETRTMLRIDSKVYRLLDDRKKAEQCTVLLAANVKTEKAIEMYLDLAINAVDVTKGYIMRHCHRDSDATKTYLSKAAELAGLNISSISEGIDRRDRFELMIRIATATDNRLVRQTCIRLLPRDELIELARRTTGTQTADSVANHLLRRARLEICDPYMFNAWAYMATSDVREVAFAGYHALERRLGWTADSRHEFANMVANAKFPEIQDAARQEIAAARRRNGLSPA